jgi:hypothetical protein
MQDLVRMAERREAACKEEMSRLLTSRSTMLEASAVADATAASAAAAAASTAAAYDQDSSRAGTPAAGATRRGGSSSGGHDAEADTAAVAAQIEATEKKMATCKAQFMRLHKVGGCVGVSGYCGVGGHSVGGVWGFLVWGRLAPERVAVVAAAAGVCGGGAGPGVTAEEPAAGPRGAQHFQHHHHPQRHHSPGVDHVTPPGAALGLCCE